MSVPDGPPLPEWFRYDVLLHSRCGRKLSDHPMPHAPEASCPFPELPPREFRRAAAVTAPDDRDRAKALLFRSGASNYDVAIDYIAAALAAERERVAAPVRALAEELEREAGRQHDRAGVEFYMRHWASAKAATVDRLRAALPPQPEEPQP